ncbi:hypothetical protein K439DRAFT_1327195, partial [Ramaria rubella]
ATSMDVEQAFSAGHLTVSRMCHSLSDESTRAATVLSSWVMVEGLIPQAEIIEAFKEKMTWDGSAKDANNMDIDRGEEK